MSAPPPYDDSSAQRLETNKDFAIDPSRSHSFALSWDFGAHAPVDLDVQALVVDFAGSIVDAAYYNNLKACGRAVTHSGDETEGKVPGIDEKVAIHFGRLPPNVQMVVVCVCCYTGGSFNDVQGGLLQVLDEVSHTSVAKYPLGSNKGNATAIILSALHCNASQQSQPPSARSWLIRPIDAPAQGRHFMDVLPAINGVIRQMIPHAPSVQRVNFQMSKGSVVDFSSALPKITCGLGWDTSFGTVDLDCSAVIFDTHANFLEAVFFGNLKSSAPHSEAGAISHSGDNLTGKGEGDDERVVINLNALGPTVAQVFFCINIYTNGVTFAQVANPYCRAEDGTQELARYQLAEGANARALIISKVARDGHTGRWGFHALGVTSNGAMYKDCMGDMQRLFNTSTATLAEASPMQVTAVQVTTTTGGGPVAPTSYAQPVVQAQQQPPDAAKPKCCIIL